MRKFCTYYANIRRYQCHDLLSQEVGALAVEVFGQDNVYTAYKVKDIMADIETIGYDQAHFSNKLKRLFEGMSLRDEENQEHLFGEQILLTPMGVDYLLLKVQKIPNALCIFSLSTIQRLETLKKPCF
ncbi:MAG: hypothetical protein ACLS5K_04440 [Streptococcus salivarius]